jgi:hypothetical protein
MLFSHFLACLCWRPLSVMVKRVLASFKRLVYSFYWLGPCSHVGWRCIVCGHIGTSRYCIVRETACAKENLSLVISVLIAPRDGARRAHCFSFCDATNAVTLNTEFGWLCCCKSHTEPVAENRSSAFVLGQTMATGSVLGLQSGGAHRPVVLCLRTLIIIIPWRQDHALSPIKLVISRHTIRRFVYSLLLTHLTSHYMERWYWNGTSSVVLWSDFLATDPEVRARFPALPDFLTSSGSGTGPTQPLEDNWGATWRKK